MPKIEVTAVTKRCCSVCGTTKISLVMVGVDLIPDLVCTFCHGVYTGIFDVVPDVDGYAPGDRLS